ncbi:MAG: DUF1150 family protein [Alphaproteobacteria bacterium]
MDSFGFDNGFGDLDNSAVGLTPLAYVRPVTTEDGVSYAVCSADGTQLAVFASQEQAWFAAKQHDLEPVHIH